MPARSFDLDVIATTIVVSSNRVLQGERPDRASPQVVTRLAAVGVRKIDTIVVAEGLDPVSDGVRQALDGGARFVLVLGGTGFGRDNEAPEAVRGFIEVEIPGLAEQIRAHGLQSTPLSGLSRSVAGVTSRQRGALIVASPGSVGGVTDTLDVVVPLLEAIFAQLDEER